MELILEMDGEAYSPYSFHISFVKILPTPNFVLVALLNLCVLRVSFVDKTERAQQGNLLVWFRQVPTFSWLARMATVSKNLVFPTCRLEKSIVHLVA